MPLRVLDELVFDNSYARLPDAFYAKLNPTPFNSPPYLVHANPAAAALIDLDSEEVKRPEFAGLFGGSMLAPGMDPLAMLYSGHQFGVYVPKLGDGRAILLGEVKNDRGERWDLHLKGAGMTPFSRDGDGRAVLRSTIREYLCCEAMHGLGIPTTRALCIVGSEEKVYREQIETGAMLVRMARSHVRFGTFEIFYYRKQHELLRVLADYVIEQHFPHLREATDTYARLFAEVVEQTAKLIARWQAVGWSHGVMNTDNMSILGLTLDYGPFGFMDDYDAGFICNHSDHNGRYAFNQQPYIGLWNLSCLAQALLPLAEKEALKAGLDAFVKSLAQELTGREKHGRTLPACWRWARIDGPAGAGYGAARGPSRPPGTAGGDPRGPVATMPESLALAAAAYRGLKHVHAGDEVAQEQQAGDPRRRHQGPPLAVHHPAAEQSQAGVDIHQGDAAPGHVHELAALDPEVARPEAVRQGEGHRAGAQGGESQGAAHASVSCGSHAGAGEPAACPSSGAGAVSGAWSGLVKR